MELCRYIAMIIPEEVTYLKEKIRVPMTYLANTNLLDKNANSEKWAQGLHGTSYHLQGKMHSDLLSRSASGGKRCSPVRCPL